jgi:DNA-directed RNA polymerase specialized sigma24 family protein
MNGRVEWIAACAEKPGGDAEEALAADIGRGSKDKRTKRSERVPIEDLPVHGFPARTSGESTGEWQNAQPVSAENAETRVGQPAEEWGERLEREPEEERERRIYRGRTVAMLRRYMRYSIETGRLPSLLGREFFRSKATSYIVVTFEDRVIFVHDMERCLERLDEFSRQLIARHILQEYDQLETGRLLGCTERTVRTYIPIVLDVLVDILLEVGLLEPLGAKGKKSCQGGVGSQNFVTCCEEGKNKF